MNRIGITCCFRFSRIRTDGKLGDIWRANFSAINTDCVLVTPQAPPPEAEPVSAPLVAPPTVATPLRDPPQNAPQSILQPLDAPVSTVRPPVAVATPTSDPPVVALSPPIAAGDNSTALVSTESNVGAIVGGVVGGTAAAGGIGFAFFVFFVIIPRRKQKKQKPDTTEKADAAPVETAYSNLNSAELQENQTKNNDEEAARKRAATRKEELIQAFKPEWMIPFKDLIFGKKLGQGAFGVVYAGKWRKSTNVAIKQSTVLCVDDAAVDAFKQEALLMLQLRPHPSCVQVRRCLFQFSSYKSSHNNMWSLFLGAWSDC